MFSGGLTAAKGISPIISRVNAEDAAAVCLLANSASSSDTCASGFSESDIRTILDRLSGGLIGEGGISIKFSGSGNGSSSRQYLSASLSVEQT